MIYSLATPEFFLFMALVKALVKYILTLINEQFQKIDIKMLLEQ